MRFFPTSNGEGNVSEHPQSHDSKLPLDKPSSLRLIIIGLVVRVSELVVPTAMDMMVTPTTTERSPTAP